MGRGLAAITGFGGTGGGDSVRFDTAGGARIGGTEVGVGNLGVELGLAGGGSSRGSWRRGVGEGRSTSSRKSSTFLSALSGSATFGAGTGTGGLVTAVGFGGGGFSGGPPPKSPPPRFRMVFGPPPPAKKRAGGFSSFSGRAPAPPSQYP